MIIESVEQPKSNNGNATVDLLIKVSGFSEKMWFTATPYDDREYGRILYEKAINNEFGPITAYSFVDLYSENRLAEYRKEAEKTVVTSGDLSSYCDTESANGLSECIDFLLDGGGDGTVSWDGPNGAELANVEQLQDLRFVVVSRRQKLRLAEKHVTDTNESVPYTGDAWKQDFDDFMGA